MRFGLLGSLEVVGDDGAAVDIGGAQQRTVLALLLLADGRVVSTDAIVDAVWGESPPASATGTLQSYISRLRRIVEPDRGRGEQARTLMFEAQGYRLVVDDDDVDIRRFERLADEGRALVRAGRYEEARATLLAADALWRGDALAELRHLEVAVGPAGRLEDRRLAASEDRFVAELELGRHDAVIGEIAELVARNPLREGFRRLLALALYRGGRQAEALRALDDARRTLRDELGVEMSRPLRDLEVAILDHDPSLDLVPPTVEAASATPPPTAAPDGPQPSASDRAGLVGRDAELTVLRAALDEAASATRVVVVEGEPGIGKTRLVEELGDLADRRGALVLWGRAFEGGATPAYWPWLPPLRALAAERPAGAPSSAELASLLAPTSDPATPPLLEPTRFALLDAVVDLLIERSTNRPVVLVLDDLQWADPGSLELLRSVAARLDDSSVLIVATVREMEVGRNDALVETLAQLTRRTGTRRLALRGLGSEAIAELVARVTEVGADEVAAINARAEGNPFFATELARLLATGDSLSDVPAGVRDVVRRRLALLPAGSTELLQVAAVIGRDIDVGLLARASNRDLDACFDDLEPALVQRLLVADPDRPGSYRFAHALVREVIVDGISTLARARLHLRVADALDDGDDQAEIRAEHLWEAAPIGVGRPAAQALERAARVALRRMAYESAQDLLERAVSLRRAAGSSPEDRLAELEAALLLISIIGARVGYPSLRFDPLLTRTKQLASELGRDEDLFTLLWAEWAGFDLSCEWDRSYRIAEDLLARADTSASSMARVLGFGSFGISCWHRGQITEAATYLDAAADASTRVPDDALSSLLLDRDQIRLPIPFSVYIHDLIGDLDDPEGAYERAVARYPGDPYWELLVTNFAASSALTVGDGARAVRAARRAIEADPDGVSLFWSEACQCYLGAALCQQGDIDDGVSVLDRAWAAYSGVGLRTNAVSWMSERSLGLAKAGRYDEALASRDLAAELMASTNERYAEAVLLVADAAVGQGRGEQPDEGRATLARARSLAIAQGARALARRVEREAEHLGLAIS